MAKKCKGKYEIKFEFPEGWGRGGVLEKIVSMGEVANSEGARGGGGGVLLGIIGRGVPPGSSNPDPISDLNMPFSTPVFRPDL